MRQTRQMGNAGDHNFQPECSATTPAVIGVKRDAAEAGGLDHLGEDRGLGKFADQLDEILIGLAVAGHGLADARNHLERIEFVKFVDARHIDRRKFQTQEPSADPENAMGLAQRAFNARHVADAEGDGDAIEAAIRVRQLLGIALLEGHSIVVPAPGGAFAADREHLGVDVADGDARAGPAGLDHAERDVAGTAGEIEHGEFLLGARRIDRGDQRVLPGPVQPARHQVVHQVVAPRHRMEHAIDHALLVGERHGLLAEMGLIARVLAAGHGQ